MLYKKNLSEKYSLFGLFNKYDEFLSLLSKGLGWPSILFRSRNESVEMSDSPDEDTAKELIERADEFYKKDQMEIQNKIKELGLESELIKHEGLTPGMLVTLGEQNILKLLDFADLSSDELTGAYDVVKGERIKIKGYLEDFALSKKEADDLIMSARDKVYKD